MHTHFRLGVVLVVALLLPVEGTSQGVTTAAITGIVSDSSGNSVAGARVAAVHVPSGTQYVAVSRASGAYTLLNLRVGGPYRVTATRVGSQPQSKDELFLILGETRRLDFQLSALAQQLAGQRIVAVAETETVRTGASITVDLLQVVSTPSAKRSTRDLTRLDPRSDGNFAFGGRNWLYNNVTLDGSYFNNSYGLDDPAPGGQTNAEPVPFEAVDQVRVSIAPFDVRQGGFTGANVNTVTKSGTNEFGGAVYSFLRTDALQGNEVRGSPVVANPDLSYRQQGLSFNGPLMKDKLFFFVAAEWERNDDPGTNFVASTGTTGFGISRVTRSTMDAISDRLRQEYNYETGPYEGYINETNNDKLLAKFDWNINEQNNASFRFNSLDATRDLGPHPFVLSFNNTGRGPNATSLPFRNSGYAINNKLQSYAFEWNSRSSGYANRLFASYNRFRDSRTPFSEDFPTIEIGDQGVTYTTAGHEPFSIHNILDQDVWQLTNNFSLFAGSHVYTVGANFESFAFFNSFNIFRHGLFHLPGIGTTYVSVQEFMTATAPTNPNQVDFRGMIGTGPFKGENVSVGQVSLYAQDEWLKTNRLTLTYGLRLDVPMYYTDPVDNPYSRGLTALDENRNPEVVDQSKLPGATVMLSPRVGFNWDVRGERRTVLRGGTGIFTGRVPFVWIGNVISNPGANPNLYPAADPIPTKKGSVLAQSFDVNAMTSDFKFPQVWTTSIGVDHQLSDDLTATIDVMYGKDLNSVFMRNADLVAPKRTLPDGRPYFGGAGASELNPDFGAGIYVIDNTSEGYSFNISGQLRKRFSGTASAGIGYSHTRAQNNLKSTEIASVLWQNQPVQGDPNNPELSYSEFGQRHRFVGDALYTKTWSEQHRTQIGIFAELAEGNRFSGAGGNRYSFIYSGDVNGDGTGGNDLIYIPRSQSEIVLLPFVNASGQTVSAQEQWTRLDAFIAQDQYLSDHRGQIAQRFGAVNPWYSTVDVRVLQNMMLFTGEKRHTLQLSFDLINVGNLINSDWGVRKVASASATSPLHLVDFTAAGVPRFNFTGPTSTYIDDPDVLSRWRAQVGLRYFFQ
jgi:hypothetical protein